MAHASSQSCECWEALLPEYVDACLRGGAASHAYAGLRRHLSRCMSCAMLVAETVAVIRWREAEEPFNRHVLSLPSLPLHRDGVGGKHCARSTTNS
jgi:hypothetical protein